MSLLDGLMQQLGGDTLQKISGQIGADEATTKRAVGAAIPTLLSAISRNAAKPEGAECLRQALEKDHDGAALDDVSQLIGNPQAAKGDGILRHVLGAKRGAVEGGLSAATGMDSGSTNKLMSILAPMVMGQLGREQKKSGLDASALTDMLTKERESVERTAPKELGFLGKMLDSDGDGDNDLGDLVSRGSGMLGKMFGK